ncbi:mCG146982 [Mus musculus]|nr:mCG146982 [Mus musculus]
MWLLGIELRTSGGAVSALNHWATSPAPMRNALDHIILSREDSP